MARIQNDMAYLRVSDSAPTRISLNRLWREIAAVIEERYLAFCFHAVAPSVRSCLAGAGVLPFNNGSEVFTAPDMGQRHNPLIAFLFPLPTACPDRKSTRLNSSHGYISYA